MRICRYTSIVLALALAAVAPAAPAAAVKAAPNVTLQRPDGAPVQLAGYKGKVLLVDFWASWCPPCKTSFPALDALQREYPGQDVEIVTVNLDERRRDADAFLDAQCR